MKKLKEKEEYKITFKGLIAVALKMDLEATKAVTDSIELYMHRNLMKGNTYGAIIYDGKDFILTSVEKENGK